MIWEQIKDWPGAIEINGTQYPSVADAHKTLTGVANFDSIKLLTKQKQAPVSKPACLASMGDATYKITVRQYMTKPATLDFDFMAKWNNNIPMPLRTMVGKVEKETSGMVYMHLHGDITNTQTQYCMKCGKAITNPVSQFFGMGPECGSHNYINPFDSEEELKVAVENYRRNYLQKITWTGWVIKSAIIEKEEVQSGKA